MQPQQGCAGLLTALLTPRAFCPPSPLCQSPRDKGGSPRFQQEREQEGDLQHPGDRSKLWGKYKPWDAVGTQLALMGIVGTYGEMGASSSFGPTDSTEV